MAWDSLITIDPDGPPLGVTRKEWNYANTKKRLGLVIIAIGVASLIGAVTVLIQQQLNEFVPTLSLQELLSKKGAFTGKGAIIATLKGSNSKILPGTDKEVIYAKIAIDAIEQPDEPLEHGKDRVLLPAKRTIEPLFHGQFYGKPLYLEDGNSRLNLNAKLDQLPIKVDHKAHFDLKLNYDKHPKSFSNIISVEYAGQVYPLKNKSEKDYTPIKDPSINIKREYLENKQTVTLIAQFDKGKIKKIASLTLGNRENAKKQSTHTAIALFLTSLFFMLGGILLNHNGKRHRDTLLKRSN